MSVELRRKNFSIWRRNVFFENLFALYEINRPVCCVFEMRKQKMKTIYGLSSAYIFDIALQWNANEKHTMLGLTKCYILSVIVLSKTKPLS